MNPNVSWLKKGDPYLLLNPRRTLAFNSHNTSGYNSSLTLQHEAEPLLRPPPRKSCLMHVDRQQLLQQQHSKEKGKVSGKLRPPQVSGRLSFAPMARKSDARSLEQVRQSMLPPRGKKLAITEQPIVPGRSVLTENSAMLLRDSRATTSYKKTVHQESSFIAGPSSSRDNTTPAVNVDRPFAGIFTAANLPAINPTNNTTAARNVGDPVPAIPSVNLCPVSTANAGTNTSPIAAGSCGPKISRAADDMPQMLNSIRSLHAEMQRFLQRYEGAAAGTVTYITPRNVSRPGFLESLDNISEVSEPFTSASSGFSNSTQEPTLSAGRSMAEGPTPEVKIEIDPGLPVVDVPEPQVIAHSLIEAGCSVSTTTPSMPTLHEENNIQLAEFNAVPRINNIVVPDESEDGVTSCSEEQTPSRLRRSKRLLATSPPAPVVNQKKGKKRGGLPRFTGANNKA